MKKKPFALVLSALMLFASGALAQEEPAHEPIKIMDANRDYTA